MRKALIATLGLTAAAAIALWSMPSEQYNALSFGSAPSMGSSTAKAVVMEFSDFHCPYCRRYVKETLPQIKREYVDTGKVLYVFRHFPLDSHPTAPEAATAAVCAAKQGKFWELHDRFFSVPPVQSADFDSHAGAVGLDLPRFRTCLAGPGKADVRTDLEEGNRIGVSGTPAFVLGVNEGGGKMRPVTAFQGAERFEAFKAALDKIIK